MTSSEGTSTAILPESEIWACGRPAKRVLVVALAIVAILQATVFVYIRARTDGPAPFVTRGDDLSNLSLRESHGALLELDAGQSTLLLVFDPDCVHSRRTATLWSNWLEGNVHRGYRIIAIARGPTATDYVRERQWPVVVTSTEPADHTITGRTPWVFAVDGQGRVVAEGHGRHLSDVAQNLRIGRRPATQSPR